MFHKQNTIGAFQSQDECFKFRNFEESGNVRDSKLFLCVEFDELRNGFSGLMIGLSVTKPLFKSRLIG